MRMNEFTMLLLHAYKVANILHKKRSLNLEKIQAIFQDPVKMMAWRSL
jgi:cell division protein FtsL